MSDSNFVSDQVVDGPRCHCCGAVMVYTCLSCGANCGVGTAIKDILVRLCNIVESSHGHEEPDPECSTCRVVEMAYEVIGASATEEKEPKV